MRRECLAIGALLVLAGCVPMLGVPPIAPPGHVRQTLHTGKRLRIVVLDFGAKPETNADTEKAALERTIPAMMLAELKKAREFSDPSEPTERFEVYDGGIERRQKAEIEEGNAHEVADAYLTGTLLSRKEGKVCFEVRLVNAVNYQVLTVRSACARVRNEQAGTDPVEPEPVMAIIDEIGRAMQPLQAGTVLSADGKLLIVNRGRALGVLPGRIAYLVDRGIADPDKNVTTWVHRYASIPAFENEVRAPAPIVGELYVLSVEKDYSVGLLYKGDFAVPGDVVQFK
jgi:hypothetical protein